MLERVLEELARLDAASRRVVAIAGESGAGKSTLALALLARLQQAMVLHQDDYFHLPPGENAQRRRQDLSWVGRDEVDLDRLGEQLRAYKAGQLHQDVMTLIVEGTYVTRLPAVDLRVFIDRDYRATEADRRARGRDPIDDHTDRVLAIEHELIREDLPLADLVLSR